MTPAWSGRALVFGSLLTLALWGPATESVAAAAHHQHSHAQLLVTTDSPSLPPISPPQPVQTVVPAPTTSRRTGRLPATGNTPGGWLVGLLVLSGWCLVLTHRRKEATHATH
ncbi:hypothetical protein [Lacticaseibacillus absianus]|uniref:hypothetical protein n=1 Tax=Lacticaseibacillus absianus TaxID=2729623 RepID=UPI0015C83FCE|nr:hypothetical protein [Lacticaseibacillus absianus]